MDYGAPWGNDGGSENERSRMGLFKRKPVIEDDGERCPRCGERVPEGANECAMCGVDLRPLRSSSGGRQVEHAPSAR